MGKQRDGAAVEERLRYYRDRAEETRTIAEMMTDPTAKGLMLHQSNIWQRMADRLAEGGGDPAAEAEGAAR